MSVELINPAGLPVPTAYAQLSVATGSRLVHLSGQVARDPAGQPVGGDDLAAQVEQAYANVATALEAVGGGFADIAKLTVYVVDWEPAKMGDRMTGVGRVAEPLMIDPIRPITLIGVSALGEPGLLVEVEAVAVLS